MSKSQQMIVFRMSERTAEILAFPFLDGRIYAFSLKDTSFLCAAGSCFFKYDIPTRAHVIYKLKDQLPTKCECLGIFTLGGNNYVLFKSLTTRHIELWDFESGSRLIQFDSENEENLIYASVRDPGYLVAYSSKSVYLWDLRMAPNFPISPVKVIVKVPLSAVAFGDGHLVGGDFGGNMHIFDTTTGSSIFDFDFGKVSIFFLPLYSKGLSNEQVQSMLVLALAESN